ncbi:hypothetical protein [Mesorhizobium erdmanii]|uniref:HD domain-containing protein n=1 Tax=Mesorhizobium erdmanii TaxID=1777866 RepID=UPI000411CDE5|nr:hypothetical protein [Mesorhizobium erdmanii]
MSVAVSAPLERLLKEDSETQPEAFPNREGGYFDVYKNMKRVLSEKFYSVAGAGLAKDSHRFTKHDISHVDDVIHTAGRMLGFESAASTPVRRDKLEPFEVFVLLTAILLHDAGNAIARDGHERSVGKIFKEISAATTLVSLEKKVITSIARAHGGKLANGDKDTIPNLITEDAPKIGGFRVHARRLAALLRLADELSEGPNRVDHVALAGDAVVSDESVLANLYCRCINPSIDYSGSVFQLSFHVEKEDLNRVFTRLDGREMTFIDYIAERLEKCECERRYCNRYLAGFASYNRMSVKLFILEDDEERLEASFFFEEKGYPTEIKPSVKDLAENFDGFRLRDKYHLSPTQEISLER